MKDERLKFRGRGGKRQEGKNPELRYQNSGFRIQRSDYHPGRSERSERRSGISVWEYELRGKKLK